MLSSTVLTASGLCPNIADVAFVMWSLTAEFRFAVNSCIDVVQAAVDKYGEVRSPSSLNTLIFYINELYRLLLASNLAL